MSNGLENGLNGETRFINVASPKDDVTLVCLNFKVPLRVRRQFKIRAAKRNLTMTELLLLLIEEPASADTKEVNTDAAQSKEIKK
jgi:hypothetical protein